MSEAATVQHLLVVIDGTNGAEMARMEIGPGSRRRKSGVEAILTLLAEVLGCVRFYSKHDLKQSWTVCNPDTIWVHYEQVVHPHQGEVHWAVIGGTFVPVHQLDFEVLPRSKRPRKVRV